MHGSHFPCFRCTGEKQDTVAGGREGEGEGERERERGAVCIFYADCSVLCCTALHNIALQHKIIGINQHTLHCVTVLSTLFS